MQRLTSTSSSTLFRLSLNGAEPGSIPGKLFTQGEMVLARVISHSRQGMVMLQLGDIQLNAHTQGTVKNGEIIQLKVVSGGKEPLLQIVQNATPETASSAPEALNPAKGSVRLLSLATKFPTPVQGEVVARVVVDSGHNGLVRLQIGKGEFSGVTTEKLARGQSIVVRVIAGGSEPQLQIIGTTDSKPDMALGKATRQPARGDSAQALPLKLITTALLKDLRVGDLVIAKVVANNIMGELSLQVGDVVIKTATNLQPSRGEQLYLQVVKAGRDILFEKIEPREFNKQLRLNAYRDVLPRQQDLVESLQKIISTNEHKGASLPSIIKASIDALIRQLPTIEKVAALPQLRQALANTGLFTEAKLLSGAYVGNDLKVNLSQIIALIRPLLPRGGFNATGDIPTSAAATQAGAGAGLTQLNLLGELLRSSDSAIARIQTQQLASLPQDDSPQQVWHLELPLFHHDKLERLAIQIERERRPDRDDESTPWTITLQMNLSPLGPMRAQLRLTGESLSTTFWAEEQSTLALVNQNLPTLKSALQRAGLVVSGLRVLYGHFSPQKEIFPEDLSLVNVKV